MAKKQKDPPEHWLNEPDEKHLLAATNYLSLLFLDADAASMVEKLRNAPAIRREANDLLRASRLELLPETDPVVKKDMKKVSGGKPLSPASYHLDEDIEISCRMVDSP